MTLSPAGRMYLLQHQAHAVRVATAKCPRCGDLLYADGQAPAPSQRAAQILICGPCGADEHARKPSRTVLPEACRQAAELEAVRAAARAEEQLEIDERRAALRAQPPPPQKKQANRPRRLTVGMLVMGPPRIDPEEP